MCFAWKKGGKSIFMRNKIVSNSRILSAAAPILLLTPDEQRTSTAWNAIGKECICYTFIYHVNVSSMRFTSTTRDFGLKVRRFQPQQLEWVLFASTKPQQWCCSFDGLLWKRAEPVNDWRWILILRLLSSHMCNLTIKEMSNGKICNVKCTWRFADKCIPWHAWLETQRNMPAHWLMCQRNSTIVHTVFFSPMTQFDVRSVRVRNLICVSEHTGCIENSFGSVMKLLLSFPSFRNSAL